MPDPSKAGSPPAGTPPAGTPGTPPAGSPPPGGGSGGKWIDSFPAVKDNAEIAARLGTYESPEAALLALSTGGWGPDWRERYAKDDKGKLTELQRYQDPGAALDGMFAAKARIREGDLAKPLPPNPNAQELKAFRELHGIPEDPKAYLTGLPDGLVIGEEDQPIFESLAAKVLQPNNLPPAAAHAIMNWYYNDFLKTEVESAGAQDAKDRQETEDALRTAWGNDFRPNQNILKSYLAGVPEPVSEALVNARDANGRALFNNPAVVQWIVGNARELQDVSTLLDGGGGPNPLLTVEQEIAKIDKVMRENRPAYNKDEAMQQRYRNLLEQRERLKNRQGKAA